MASLFRELGRATAGGVPKQLWTVLFLVVAASLTLTFVPITPATIVGLLALALAIATLVSAVEIVNAYEKRALTVFGEYRKLLEPGLNLVPPFVSQANTQTVNSTWSPLLYSA